MIKTPRLAAALLAGTLLLAGCWGEDAATPADWTKLGSDPWTSEAWSTADQAARGRMVADFLEQNAPMGKDSQTVIDLLGEPTGYYDYDTNLAYVVGPTGQIESVYADGYLLVFETADGKVSAIRAVPDLQ